MTMTSRSDRPTRRVRVEHDPLAATIGAKPWRAVIPAVETAEVKMPEIPVGRFDSQHEAITAGCSALRFVAAGIPWTVQP